jgi:hypothetical protein
VPAVIVPGGADGPAGDDPTSIGGDPVGGLGPSLAVQAALVALGSAAFVIARRKRRGRNDPALAGPAAAASDWPETRDPPAAAKVAQRVATQRPPDPRPVAAEPPVLIPDPILTSGAVARILPGEAGIPRWRRPSLKEERSRSDRAAAPVHRALGFSGPPEEGVERLVVRYDLVPLLDHPDEVTGIPIGELAAGDEVDVIARRAVWAEVRTPNRRIGWVHRTTLAAPTTDAIDEPVAMATAVTTADEPDELAPDALDTMLATIVANRRAAAEAAEAAEAATRAAEHVMPPIAPPRAKPQRAPG